MRRQTLLALEAFSLLLLLGGALRERAAQGVESELLVLALLLAPAHLRRLLAFLGRAPAPHPLLLLLELACFTGLAAYPLAPFAVSLGVLVALLHALPSSDAAPEPSRWLSATVLALALGAGLLLGRDLVLERELSVARLVFYVAILVETLAPGRARSDVDSLRRASAFITLVALSLSPGEGLHPVFRLLTLLAIASASLVHLSLVRVSAEDRPRVRRRRTFKLLVPPVLLAIVLASGELLMRIVPNRNAELVTELKGDWHVPGGTYVYEGGLLGPKQPRTTLVHWNKDGWHDADHAIAKPPGTARVVVLGDSFIDGLQVELDELYHRQLEAALAARSPGAVEAIALGWCGWGQIQEDEVLTKKGLAFLPDVVVLEFLPGNDVRNNQPELERLANEEGTRANFAQVLRLRALREKLLFHAFLLEKLDLTLRRLQGQHESLDAGVYQERPPRPELWTEGWSKTEALVLSMNEKVTRAGGQLVVVVFTSPGEIEARVPGTKPLPGLDLSLPARRMEKFCAIHAIPICDLAPRFARLPTEARAALHLAGDGHWTAAGHRAAALETAKFLVEETDIWKRALAR